MQRKKKPLIIENIDSTIELIIPFLFLHKTMIFEKYVSQKFEHFYK
jgi:hypothetical protein